jgi:hypothetical protein
MKVWTTRIGLSAALMASGLMALTTGCASGGYHLTRMYAGFVNSQHIILRIILYIFTTVVFAVTMIIDLIFFNTIDFWEGRLSSGIYDFKKDGKNFHVHHEVLPGNLKRSTITIKDLDEKLLQQVIFRETASNEIELYVDGKLRTRVRDIRSIPTASVYNEKGQLTSDEMIPLFATVAKR